MGGSTHAAKADDVTEVTELETETDAVEAEVETEVAETEEVETTEES